LKASRPVVALESTLICHGLPRPQNLHTALACETAVRNAGATPATIAVWNGVPKVGMTNDELQTLAEMDGVWKAARRDLAITMGLGRTAATTVSATMALAHAAGIRVFATGGIGGVHRGSAWDISADLVELSRTPVLVVCAGAKSLLDLPRTLELLETLQVPVLGYRTTHFPAFYTEGAGLPVSARVDSPEEAARVAKAHFDMGGGGLILAQPVENPIPVHEFESALAKAEADAQRESITGAAITPFVLKRLAELTHGRTLAINQTLIVQNATLAAHVAKAIAG
jgi:pseudouridine-5'-phosphate glycosidase